MSHVAGIGQHVLGVAALHGVARVLLRFAQGFPAAQAVGAAAAGRVQPGNAHPVAFFHLPDTGPHGYHPAHAFVARDERQGRLYGPVAVHGVQVGVADARSSDLHQDLSVPHLGNGYFFDA
jgi:hypothetical protein